MRESSYLLESILIESFEREDKGMRKVAFDLGGIASEVSSSVKDQVDVSSPGAAAETLAKFLVPGVLFKISPILGVLDVAASFIGLDVVSLFEKLKNYILPKVSAGETIDPSAITNLGKQLAGSDADEGNVTVSFSQLLGELKKNSAGYRGYRGYPGYGSSSTSPTIPFFGGNNSNWLARIFGDLFKARAKGKARWLVVGFITWLVKTTLLSAGLLAVGGVIKNMIHPSDTPKSTDQNPDHPYVPSEGHGNETQNAVYHPDDATENNAPSKSGIQWKASGRGEEMHVNDATTSIWAVPSQGSIQSTLDAWISDIYPDFDGDVDNAPFYQMVSEFTNANQSNTSTKQLLVPKQYKSRKQVVDKILSQMERA